VRRGTRWIFFAAQRRSVERLNLPGAGAGKARGQLCGWVVTYRQVGTKNYRNMMFVTLEDQRGVYEVLLFPDAYDRYGGPGV